MLCFIESILNSVCLLIYILSNDYIDANFFTLGIQVAL